MKCTVPQAGVSNGSLRGFQCVFVDATPLVYQLGVLLVVSLTQPTATLCRGAWTACYSPVLSTFAVMLSHMHKPYLFVLAADHRVAFIRFSGVKSHVDLQHLDLLSLLQAQLQFLLLQQ